MDNVTHFIATDSESEKDESEESDSEPELYDDFDSVPGANEHVAPNIDAQLVRPFRSENGYYDDGDPIFMCSHCDAYMWFGERLNRRAVRAKPTFSTCCHQGKVKIPLMKAPPKRLLALLYNHDDKSKNYRELIRLYNMMFSFTSMGGKVNHVINNGRGPYVFQMYGQNFHRIGDLLPPPGKDPVFLQLYIHDIANEVSNRIKACGQNGSVEKIREDVVMILKNMLDTHNPHVKALRTVQQRFESSSNADGLKLVLSSGRRGDSRTHNLPSADEVAALVPCDFQLGVDSRDIVIESHTGKFQRISEIHPAYLPLQYPLLFPYGIDIGYVDTKGRKRKTISMREYFAFRIYERYLEAPTILMSGKLFQQFLIDVFTMLEANRLKYVRLNQKKLRSENYNNIKRALSRGNKDLSSQGKRIFIPTS